MLLLTRRGNVRHLSLLNFSVCFSMYLFVYLLLAHVTTLPSINAVILWLFLLVYAFVDAFPEIVNSNFKFHICGPVLSSVRDLYITRLGMVEITYTQIIVEKYLERPCVGSRILVIKCQLMSCQCVEWPNGSESCSLAA